MAIDRRNVALARARAASILDRARFLPEADHALLRQVLDRGSPVAHLAPLTGAHPRNLQRHVRQLLDRLDDPDVTTVIRLHDRWPDPLPAVAIALFVHRRSNRDTARSLGLTLHDVRQHRTAVQTLINHHRA